MTWGTLLAYCLAKPGACPEERWEGDEWLLRYPKKDRP
jgi:hypothetical protein